MKIREKLTVSSQTRSILAEHFPSTLVGAFLWALVLCLLSAASPAMAQIKRLADLPSPSSSSLSSAPFSKPAPTKENLKPVPEDLLKDIVFSYLEEQGFSDVDLLFDRSNGAALLDYESPTEVHLLSCEFNEKRTRITATLASDKRPSIKISLQATLDPLVEIPVLSHSISVEHLLTLEDIRFVKVPARKVSRQSVTKVEDLLGSYVKPSAAQPNRLLKRFDLHRPQLIKRGQTVALSVKHHKLAIQTSAKALENGEQGQSIRLLNTDNNHSLHATVTAPGRAEIDLSTPTATTATVAPHNSIEEGSAS